MPHEFHMKEPSSSSLARFWMYMAVALAVVALDQATKWAVTRLIAYGHSIDITSFFNLVYVRNTGAAFSFLANMGGMQVVIFSAIALVVSAVLMAILWMNSRARPLFCTSLALMLGGAIGNLIDRLAFGSVVDFLDFYLGAYHWPAFNVADIAVCCGAAGIILESFLHKSS